MNMFIFSFALVLLVLAVLPCAASCAEVSFPYPDFNGAIQRDENNQIIPSASDTPSFDSGNDVVQTSTGFFESFDNWCFLHLHCSAFVVLIAAAVVLLLLVLIFKK